MKRFENLEELITSNDINSAIIELDNFIGELCDYGEDFSKLTSPQKSFYLIQNLEREVNNGGFSQYFYNSSGDNAHETVLSLKEINADITANILLQAIDQFPFKNVPLNREKRMEIFDQIQEEAVEIWNELDERFFKYEDDLNTLNIEYIKKNKQSF